RRRIMRWYCVLCFCASLLKNSTLRLLSAIVTLTPSSRKTKSSGLGRKSGTTFGSPRGSSVYLILSLIDSLSFAPVSSPVDSDDLGAIRKADRQNAATDLAKAVVPLLSRAVG